MYVYQQVTRNRGPKSDKLLEENKMMAVQVETGQQLRISPPRVLFESSYILPVPRPSYDVGPDGRFLIIEYQRQGTQINVILNWFEELKRLVPID